MNETIWYFVWVFLFGLCCGSFFNVCIYRIPLKKSIVTPSSFCPNCKGSIKFYDNIPVLSFILLRGRCRNCDVKISLRYPSIELLTGLLFALLYVKFGLTFSFFIHAIYVGALIVVTFIDLDYKIIPDVITLRLIGFGYMISWIPNVTVNHWASLFGILVGGGFLFLAAFFYQVIAKKEGMGGGDIKLMAMVGSIMGPWKVFISIFFASFLGMVLQIRIGVSVS